jgi:hypothetical protein
MNQSFCVVVVSTHEGGTLAREMDPFFDLLSPISWFLTMLASTLIVSRNH